MSASHFRSTFYIKLFLFLFVTHETVFAQNKYWVSFTDKAGVSFNPSEYFSKRTIERRIRYHISLNDSTDFPVSENYIRQIQSLTDSLGWSSRWLNGVAVYASEEDIKKITELSFVKDVQKLYSVSQPAEKNKEDVTTSQIKLLKPNQLALLKYQTERLQGNLFSEKNIDGKGILIAVFDAGFPEVNHREELSHLFRENRIKATYDFVTKKENVYANYPHGTATLSCIAGKYGDINIGLAPGAEFLLARTERAQREAFSEEENWLAAAEWADKYGADIISSSLGYSNERYFNNEMNGKKSLAARAASMAAAKGMLVVVSAGNDGDNSWKFISTPADADSVLAVGGTDPYSDMRIDFSSWGPSSDGRLKPEVCAPAEVMAVGKKGMTLSYGTSFSCPLVAGFAACVWQTHRDWNNVEVYHMIEESGHLYPYYDYAHGYGIPQASYFTELREKNIKTPTFHFEVDRFEIKIILSDEYLSTVQNTRDSLKQHNMYYHIANPDGGLAFYAVLDAKQREVFSVDVQEYSTYQELVVHFEGYTATYRFIDFKR